MSSLKNKKLLLLRNAEDFDETAKLVREYEAVPVTCPMIDIQWPQNCKPLDDAIYQLGTFDWVLFTSGNSVRFFFERVQMLQHNLKTENVRFGVIGKATHNKLNEYRIQADFVSSVATAEGFLNEFAETYKIEGLRFFLPLSEIARDTLPNGLKERGGIVSTATAYVNQAVEHLPDTVINQLKAGEIDWVLFTSSSTAKNFYSALSKAGIQGNSFSTASIGPKTSETLSDLGCSPAVEAIEHTMSGLLDAIDIFEKSSW